MNTKSLWLESTFFEGEMKEVKFVLSGNNMKVANSDLYRKFCGEFCGFRM